MGTEAKTILLNRFQFCHVLDRNTGALRLEAGADGRGKRITLESHEELHGEIRPKIRVSDGQFAIVLNPHDRTTNDLVLGAREIRRGPTEFPLFPGEELEGGKVHDEFVLTDDEALLLRARKDAPHPLVGVNGIPANAVLRSGEEVLFRGPQRYIPHVDIEVKERRRAIALSEDRGAYVQDNDTGIVRLIRGPADCFVEQNESLWTKPLTTEELEALGYQQQKVGDDSRVLAVSPRARKADWEAVVIELEDNEALCVYEDDRRRIEFGPKKVFLGPHERPKILYISGGVPVRPNVLRIAKLALGPDFIRDQLAVRTKDNAVLTLEVTYRWRFRIDPEHPERLFALKDFVGFAAQALSSEIRETAARHDFEAFHSSAAVLIKQAVFGDDASHVFAESGLEILGIDVEGIIPEDEEIAAKLTDTIKTTVDIVTRRQQEEAQLESERRIIEGRARNEEQRKRLVELEIENLRSKTIGEVRTDAEALTLKAQAEAEAIRVRAQAEAEAERARRKAAADVEREQLEAQAATLATEGGERLIELERARALKATDKLVVPTQSRLYLGVRGTFLDQDAEERT